MKQILILAILATGLLTGSCKEEDDDGGCSTEGATRCDGSVLQYCGEAGGGGMFGGSGGLEWSDVVDCQDQSMYCTASNGSAACSYTPGGDADTDTDTDADGDADVMLMYGSTSSQGVVMVNYGGQLRGICDDGWTQTETNVLCRELFGVTTGTYTTYNLAGYDVFWLDDVYCLGTESSILQCSNSGWGYDNCSASEHIWVACGTTATYCGDSVCSGAETCSTCPGDCGTCVVTPYCGDSACNGTETCSTCPGDCGVCGTSSLSLVGGSTAMEGVLMFNNGGDVRGVCDDGWTTYNTQVVCRELFGAATTGTYTDGYNYSSGDSFWLDDVYCYGTETSLLQCDNGGLGYDNCSDSEHVWISCAYLQ